MTNFTYSGLPSDSFRLLQLEEPTPDKNLRCTLFQSPLRQAPKFTALSYCWNDESPSTPITCNNQVLRITRSLYDALSTLQGLRHPRPIWADALSINQDDHAEKETQVPLMSRIYSFAHTVVIWLGPSGLHTDVAMQSIASLKGSLSESEPLLIDDPAVSKVLPKEGNDVWHGLGDIYNRKWFTRLWTVQEAALAKRLLVHCGSATAAWDDMYVLGVQMARCGIQSWANSAYGVGPQPQDHMDGYNGMLFPTEVRDLLLRGVFPTFRGLMQNPRKRDTSEAVDKVYAVLSLANPSISRQIKIDYSLESRQQFWRLYIDVGHLMLLDSTKMYFEQFYPSNHRIPDLPSWCPNFNERPAEHGFNHRGNRAGGVYTGGSKPVHFATSLDKKRIMLQGFQVDIVTEVANSTFQLLSESIWGLGLQAASAKAIEWLNDCHQIYQKVSACSKAMDVEFMRCLIANEFNTWQKNKVVACAPDSKEVEHGFRNFFALLRNTAAKEGPEAPHVLEPNLTEGQASATRYLNALDRACQPRRFFGTSRGWIGLGTDHLQPGDSICIFQNINVPLVLRRMPQEDVYELVGQAYVHRIMQGEALDLCVREDIKIRQFTVA